MIEDYYDKTFTVRRPAWTTDEDDNAYAEEQTVGTFSGQLQQANPELVAHLALSYTKAFALWCPVNTDVKEGDTLLNATEAYSVKAVMKNNIGENKHLELVVQLEAEILVSSTSDRDSEIHGEDSSNSERDVELEGETAGPPQSVTMSAGTFGTQVGGGSNPSGWNNVSNAGASDDSYATASSSFGEDPITNDTNIMKLSNFGFAIPVDAVILGIEVSVEKKANVNAGSNWVKDLAVQLIKADGSIGTENKADTVTQWQTSDHTVVYGADDDLWSESLTPAIVNDVDFGVAFRAKLQSTTQGANASVDHISITVHYQE